MYYIHLFRRSLNYSLHLSFLSCQWSRWLYEGEVSIERDLGYLPNATPPHP